MKKIIGSLLTIIFLCLCLVSCNDNSNDNTPTLYTVTFNSNEGSAVSTQEVEAGSKVAKPENPTKDGFTFVGWFSDSALTDEWLFDSDVVNENITLYAKWEGEYTGYMVTVYRDGNVPVSGVIVQWCDDKLCHGGTTQTDENGELRYPALPDGTYNVHLLRGVPAGYTYNPNIQTTVDNKQIVVNLIKIDEASGSGTIDSPYVVSTGNYVNGVEKIESRNYYSFTPTEAKTYIIESHVMAIQNSEPLDLLLVLYADAAYSEQLSVHNEGGEGDNFKYELVVEEADLNKPIYFAIQPARTQNEQTFPNEYYFSITVANN